MQLTQCRFLEKERDSVELTQMRQKNTKKTRYRSNKIHHCSITSHHTPPHTVALGQSGSIHFNLTPVHSLPKPFVIHKLA